MPLPPALAALPEDARDIIRTFAPSGAGRFAAIRLAEHLPTGLRSRRARVAELPLRGAGPNRAIWIRGAGSSDSDVVREIFFHGEYRALEARQGVRTILDLGANVGLAAARLLRAHPRARVLAIEADPANAALCRRNLAAFGDRAEVLHAAVWSRPGRVALRRDGDGREWTVSVTEPRPGEPTIPAVDVPALLDRLGTGTVDVLKIDVEGAEAELFRGPAAQGWLRRTRALAVEVHGDEARDRVLAALRDAGATVSEHADVISAELPPAA